MPKGRWIFHNERSMLRSPLEPFDKFAMRNVEWWRINRTHERVSRHKYYEEFLEKLNIRAALSNDLILGEVGGGPFGGVIEVCELPAKSKVFLDYIMMAQVNLKFIRWPEDALYVECPAEDIPLDDLSMDVLLSYNCLDHGWDIERALGECHRVAKRCFLSFDSRGDNLAEYRRRQERNDIDHKQFIKKAKVEKILDSLPDCKWKLSTIETRLFPKLYMELNHVAS